MKRLLIALFILCGTRGIAPAQVGVSITYQQFYNELEPYGTWINYPQYGYVWEPRMGDFTPYSSGGRWVYTDDGWTWVSDYPWGWAPYHYGRWFYDDYMGWLWMPGYEWAPAWVTWGSYGGNYGWAPLGPGIGISVGWRPPRNYWWTFVPCNRFGGDHWNNYIVRNNVTIVNHVSVINNVYRGGGGGNGWMRGPRREEVEHFTNRRIQPAAFTPVSRPGATRVQNNSIAIYRPAVSRAPQGGQFRPQHVQPLASVRPATRLPNRDNGPASRPGSTPGSTSPARPAEAPHTRPDRPYSPNPGQHPANNPANRPINPGTRPESRPVPNNIPSNHPVSRPNNPVQERPVNRPPVNNRPPAMPGNRPVNPNPGRPPMNRPVMPQNHPMPQNRPVPQQQHNNPPEPRRNG